jgi:hypothetical protein
VIADSLAVLLDAIGTDQAHIIGLSWGAILPRNSIDATPGVLGRWPIPTPVGEVRFQNRCAGSIWRPACTRPLCRQTSSYRGRYPDYSVRQRPKSYVKRWPPSCRISTQLAIS